MVTEVGPSAILWMPSSPANQRMPPSLGIPLMMPSSAAWSCPRQRRRRRLPVRALCKSSQTLASASAFSPALQGKTLTGLLPTCAVLRFAVVRELWVPQRVGSDHAPARSRPAPSPGALDRLGGPRGGSHDHYFSRTSGSPPVFWGSSRRRRP
jgi:hypothetical protein